MKNLKITPKHLFWLVLAITIYDLGFHLYNYKFFFRKNLGAVLSFSTLSMLTIYLFIAFKTSKLLKRYENLGFFDAESVKITKNIAWLILFIAPIQAFSEITFDILVRDLNKQSLGELHLILLSLVTEFLFRSPAYLFISIVLYLFADFMQKSIILKEENEAII